MPWTNSEAPKAALPTRPGDTRLGEDGDHLRRRSWSLPQQVADEGVALGSVVDTRPQRRPVPLPVAKRVGAQLLRQPPPWVAVGTDACRWAVGRVHPGQLRGREAEGPEANVLATPAQADQATKVRRERDGRGAGHRGGRQVDRRRLLQDRPECGVVDEPPACWWSRVRRVVLGHVAPISMTRIVVS